MQEVRLLLCCMTFVLAAWPAQGAKPKVVRGNCTPQVASPIRSAEAGGAGPRLFLPQPDTQWNPDQAYKQVVLLVEFADQTFAAEHSTTFYNSLFNAEGFNQGHGEGCVADYFRDQSSGLFNLVFDVYGPVRLPISAKAAGTYGGSAFRTAAQKMVDSLHVDLSPYDWNGDGRVNQLIIVYAGYGGNESADVAQSCIWPNTSSFSAITAQGTTLSAYSASPEMWSNKRSCGIGTICHEFCHCLGLPDLYPVSSSGGYSVVDEWDLMDGGNYTDQGWCPPNFSAHEKMLLGWLTPVELSASAHVSGLEPVSQGGNAYLVPVEGSTSEYLLLENRQWEGWDKLSPGQGLLIAHVDYSASAWSTNRVNSNRSARRYDYYHADNMDYDQWDDYLSDGNLYVDGHSQLLSGTPYPRQGNNRLTDNSQPAATVFSSASGFLSKPITDIALDADGLVSFNFSTGDGSDGIRQAVATGELPSVGICYNLRGQAVKRPCPGVLYIRNGKKFFYSLL